MRRARAIAGCALAALLVTGLTACSDEPEDEGAIDVWIGFTDYRLDWAKERAAEFTEKHPEFTVNVQGYESYEVLFDALTAASQQGEPPTIVQNFEAATQESRDAVNADGEPLFASVEDAIGGRDEILGEPVVLDDVVDAARSYYTVDGEFSSMPWNTSTTLFYSNSTYLEAAGVDAPPQTWEDVTAACDKIMALDDAPANCISWPNHSWFPEQVLAEQGGLLADQDNGRSGRAENVDLTSPEWLSFIEYWKELNDSGHYYYSGVQEDWDGPKNAFGGQEVAFLLTSSGDATSVVTEAEATGFEAQVSRMPVFADKPYSGNLIGGATLWLVDGLPENTRDGALAFMQYLNNPENAADWHKTTGYIPITNSAIELLETEGWFEENPYQQVATDQLALSDGSPAASGVLLGSFVAIRAEITKAVEDILTSGADPATRFEEADAAAQQLLDEYNSLYSG
ncbi:carbohydrate ABC transporter substrate-binding protein, CUT1 family (TC 3.A.1.1.-) [Stackebrandtia albiflava]|uniref:Carbohydrate ABC transporter substrate-binding protein, CUT1 family (TC 3.A.1.1.-) n=1 Tax=Stackebrandtia albiflava TaxID=406432 RepID=A0A562UQP4_9ACTN|nr:extracellular solute-binding protein [Stackebrandtia albiflava]TWJ07943.1 carbohydrate ABC transporter substrate-binding protein, CUT1 family (TC 3.A.1.1.-) [Stackebrandtia albiflava]